MFHLNRDKKIVQNKNLSMKLLIISVLTIGILTSVFYGKLVGFVRAEVPTNATRVTATIDYVEETVKVTPGDGKSDKFYMSTDNGKTWDLIEYRDESNSPKVDISTLLKTKEVTIHFKGNKDLDPVPVVLKDESTDLKPVYTLTNGVGSIVWNLTGVNVEYRKGANGQWKAATNGMKTELYELKGATLYFRIVATPAQRAGKIVTFKVAKKAAAPAVKLDGSKLCISGMKLETMEYRANEATEWKTFEPTDPKEKTLDLSTLFGINVIDSNNNITQTKAGVIEIRTKATNKKVASLTKLIEVPQQPVVPSTIDVSGTKIIISDPDTKRAYEYTLVEKGSTLNLKTAKWTSMTSAKPVIVKKALKDDMIYVRLKSTTDKVSKIVTPASTYMKFTVNAITTN